MRRDVAETLVREGRIGLQPDPELVKVLVEEGFSVGYAEMVASTDLIATKLIKEQLEDMKVFRRRGALGAAHELRQDILRHLENAVRMRVHILCSRDAWKKVAAMSKEPIVIELRFGPVLPMREGPERAKDGDT